LDCYHTGAPISVSDLSQETARWPQFVPAALGAGFASVHALPIRLRTIRLGALNLFGTEVGSLNADDLALGQALAHVAGVALVHGKAATDKDLVLAQLNAALTSRVVVEQAKGVLAQTAGLDMDEAFTVLRRYAREHHEGLSEVAAAVVRRELAPEQFLDQPAGPDHPATRSARRRKPPASNEH
jgi:ANTAR domain/GAF domain